MGLFEKIFPRPRQKQGDEYFKLLTAYTPHFTSREGRIYESAIVRSAIHARATHISKLKIDIVGTSKPRVQTWIKDAPNEFMTWGQFLYRTSTILDAQNTAFIVPILEPEFGMTGVYPVLPSQCDIVEASGEPWLRYRFADGSTAAIEKKYCGILTKYQYGNDFFGESNNALQPTMSLIDMQNQGIEEGIRNGASYRFFARVGNFSKAEDLAKERRRFDRENFEKEGGGMLLFPNTYTDIKQIDAKPFVISAAQMQAIEQNVYSYFGVNADIIQNKAFGDAWAAFYEGAIEPFAIQVSEVLTRMIFTTNERARGTKIMATANRLQYMTNQDKLNVSAQMADRGIMNRDEIREIWNLPPLPNGIGQPYPVRGEYYTLEEKQKDGE